MPRTCKRARSTPRNEHDVTDPFGYMGAVQQGGHGAELARQPTASTRTEPTALVSNPDESRIGATASPIMAHCAVEDVGQVMSGNCTIRQDALNVVLRVVLRVVPSLHSVCVCVYIVCCAHSWTLACATHAMRHVCSNVKVWCVSCLQLPAPPLRLDLPYTSRTVRRKNGGHTTTSMNAAGLVLCGGDKTEGQLQCACSGESHGFT